MVLKKIIILVFLGVTFVNANGNLMEGLTNIVDKAEDKKAEDKKVLNYAFKQRMRTQWIARDILLVSMDFDASHYQNEAIKNANAFNENFYKLIESKADIEKAEKLYPNFPKKVNELNITWSKFYESVKKISKDKKDKESVKFIVENNIKLLDDISYIFTHFINSYQSSDKLEASMAHIKSMLYTQVGKPRLYVNRMVKNKLSLEKNIAVKESKKSIQEDIEKMDQLMKALKDGDKELELNGTEDRKILEKLSVSQSLWEEVKVLIQKKKLKKEEWSILIQKNDDFIEAQTEVVKLTLASNDN